MAPSVRRDAPSRRRPGGPFAVCLGTRLRRADLSRATESDLRRAAEVAARGVGYRGRMTTAWRSGFAWLRRHPDRRGRRAGAGAQRRGAGLRLHDVRAAAAGPGVGRAGRGLDRRHAARRHAAADVPEALPARSSPSWSSGAFVVGRVLVNPGLPGLAAWEGVVTIWAVWVALYTAVAHGPRSRATVAVVAAVALVGDRRGRARDLLLRGRASTTTCRSTRASGWPTTPSRSRSRSRSGSPSAGCGSGSGRWRRRPRSCTASARRTRAAPCSTSACGSRASSTTSSPTT